VRTLYAPIVAALSLAGCGLGNPDLRILPDATPNYEFDVGFSGDLGIADDRPAPDVPADLGSAADVRDAATDRGPDDRPTAPDVVDAGELPDAAEDVGAVDVADPDADLPLDAPSDAPVDVPVDSPATDSGIDVPPADVGVDVPGPVDVPVPVDVPPVDVPPVDVPPVDVPPVDVPPVDVPIVWRVADADQASTAWRSGAPDGSFDNLYCPPGQLLVGLTTWGDVFVSGLAPWCARLNPDGSLGTAARGDRQGGVCCFANDDRCPPNQAVVRLVINSGAVVDRVQAVCAPLPGWLARREIGASLTGRGGGGGSRNTDDCPTGYVGSGLNLQSGAYQFIERVRSLRMRCSRVSDR
jgi:hypothetical protein